ncbi:MAG: hypothetical protein HYU67_14015 [Flavobacteriia bacterium]|nr:hypothetical protein [Flavobacteriia bacterium]
MVNKIFLFVLLFLFISCNRSKEKQLNKVNQLLSTCDSLENIYKLEKNDSIPYFIQGVMDVELKIKKNFTSDTVSLDFAKKINRFKMIRKKLKPILKQNMKFSTAFYELKQSILTLKKDIENNAGDKNRYEEYLLFEEKKVNSIKLVLLDNLKIQKEQIKNYHELHNELYGISMNITK